MNHKIRKCAKSSGAEKGRQMCCFSFFLLKLIFYESPTQETQNGRNVQRTTEIILNKASALTQVLDKEAVLYCLSAALTAINTVETVFSCTGQF